jgi:transposase-like protein
MKQIHKVKRLNYKDLMKKKIIVSDVVNKLNEIIDILNKISYRKPIKTKILLKNTNKKRVFNGISCPKCKSKNLVKRGRRKNLERGYIQRYFCKDCNNRFTPKNMEYRMRVSEVKLKKAIELFNEGLSYSQIAKKIKGVSRQTIGRWLIKYNIPKQDKIFEREMKSRWGGTYKRKFNIKYKKQMKNASTKR